MPTNISIVEDNDKLRGTLAKVIGRAEGFRFVSDYGSAEEALADLPKVKPDVVLMDIRMPGLDGIEATKQIREARVLILTTFGHDEYVVEALMAGASGFLLKDATPEELVHAVRVVANGESLLAPAVTTTLLAQVLPTLGQAPAGESARSGASREMLSQLTDRELEVLKLLAKGWSNAEIATELYISEATVKTHVSHLLSKLGLRDRVQAVVLAFEAGLVKPKGR